MQGVHRPDAQAGRDPVLVEQDRAVRLEAAHLGDAEGAVSRARLALVEQPEARLGDLDGGGLVDGAQDHVADLDLAAPPAGARGCRAVGLDLGAAVLAQRQGQVDDARPCRAVDRDRVGERPVLGQREGRAVGQDAPAARDADLALRQQLAVERQLAHAPAVPDGPGQRAAHQLLDPAVLLLEMLRPEQHPLGPHDLAGARHRRSRPLGSRVLDGDGLGADVGVEERGGVAREVLGGRASARGRCPGRRRRHRRTAPCRPASPGSSRSRPGAGRAPPWP